MFFWNSCFFDDPANVGNLISGSSAFSKASLNLWKFTVHVLLKPGLENFEHYFASVWDECNCVVFWAFFGIAFLWDWNENWPFPVLWPLLSFPNLLTYWVQHFHSIIFGIFGIFETTDKNHCFEILCLRLCSFPLGVFWRQCVFKKLEFAVWLRKL